MEIFLNFSQESNQICFSTNNAVKPHTVKCSSNPPKLPLIHFGLDPI